MYQISGRRLDQDTALAFANDRYVRERKSAGRIEELYQASAALHSQLCPRQVLGVRMGLFGGELLGIQVPQADKRLLTIVEIDGCFADGVSAATNCWVGRRTLQVENFGKVAATFIDTDSGAALRVHPRTRARAVAQQYGRRGGNRWERYLLGYQAAPLEQLFSYHRVGLSTPVARLISDPSRMAVCERCAEEIFNQREVIVDGILLCRGCAGGGYLCRENTI